MRSLYISDISEFVALPLALSLPRIAAALFMLALLARGTPIYVRGAIALSVAMFVHPIVSDQLFGREDIGNFAAYAPIVLKEALIGGLIGLAFSLPLRIFEMAGGLMDFQSGLTTAAMIDPLTNTEVGPYGRLLLQFGIALFVAAGGLAAMIEVLGSSFRAWPVMSFMPALGEPLKAFLVEWLRTLFLTAAGAGFAVVVLLLAVELGIGFISRLTPQMNVFMFAMSIKAALVALTLSLTLPFLSDGLHRFLQGDEAVQQRVERALTAPTAR